MQIHDGAESENIDDSESIQLAQKLDNPGRVCPNCKDSQFVFKEISSKIVRSLLSNLKVTHKCDSKSQVLQFKHEDLKKHILTECAYFMYQCVLCEDLEN